MEKQGSISNIIAIGASAGGINAVSKLVSTFGQDLEAAVFIVIHLSRSSNIEVILNSIQKHTSLKCVEAKDQERIENGTIYLAPPDHHMLLEKGTIIVSKGAYENHFRPSIDVLFRSAAAAYDSCVTGIILTGLLDDGTSGMFAIKRSGGLCIIQDPGQAEFPDMPNNVLLSMDVDYQVPVEEMGYIVADLFTRKICTTAEVPADVKLEAEIARRMSSSMEDLKKLGGLTTLTCPDCGGILAHVKHDAVSRYRCYTGHTFTEMSLENEQDKGLEKSLWVAIRMLEERKNLLQTMMRQQSAENEQVTQAKRQRVDAIQIHIERLKLMLMEMGDRS